MDDESEPVAGDPTELVVLRSVALGGRVDAASAARRVGVDEARASAALEAATAQGLMAQQRGMHRLTPEGRTELERLLVEERAQVDTASASELYQRFCSVNDEFKQYVTDLQLSGDDPVASVGRLREIHVAVRPLVVEAVAIAPRLAPFQARFDTAVAAVTGGDARYVSHPLVDSYHGTWFELHEELIHLAGLSRSEEAAQGRG